MNGQISQDEINAILWRACDTFRGTVDPAEYKIGKQRQFLQGLKAQVRWACRVANRPEQSWEDTRLLDSSHPLIQCVDMITGAVADHANHNDDRWLAAISAQMAVLWHERFEMDREKRHSLD